MMVEERKKDYTLLIFKHFIHTDICNGNLLINYKATESSGKPTSRMYTGEQTQTLHF